MPYPARPRLEPLPAWAGSRGRWLPPGRATQLRDLVTYLYVHDQRSLREISELTDRSHREIANILSDADIPRRPAGAPVTTSPTSGH